MTRAKLRRVRRLCRALEIDAYSALLIVDMLERMEAMQRELDALRALHPPHFR